MTTSDEPVDVLIAGAGPVGLMLAAELALGGARPVVLEARTEPGAEPRANGLVGQVVPMVDRRGLYEELAGTPGPPEPNRAYFFFGGLPLDLSLLDDSPVHTLPVPQARIVEVLAARVARLGVTVRWGHALTGVTRDGDGVVAEVRGPDGDERVAARYLVGAEGAHSVVRKAAGIAFPGIGLDRMTTFSAHVSVPADLVDPATGGLRVPGLGVVRPFLPTRTPRGGVTWAPFPGRLPMISTLEWDLPAADGPMSFDAVRAGLRRVLGTDLPLGPPDASDDGTPHLLRRLDGGQIRVAERLRDGPLFLAGDAAHVYAAGGGPGLNLGLQDAVNLGWKLAAVLRGAASDALLDTYSTERRAAADRVLTASRAQAALLAPGADVDGLRSLLGEILTDAAAVARLAAVTAGTDVRYPVDDDAHPAAGYFAPDRSVSTADGPVRLAELARSGRPLLIDPSGTLDASPGVQVLHGTLDGDGPAALLVRPDGYVAWASDSADPSPDEREALRRTVARWFGAHAGVPS
jgi:2-polyprenyl-6-methoxyphenol hydroxylase-like FAD-dependent oxidoreductase